MQEKSRKRSSPSFTRITPAGKDVATWQSFIDISTTSVYILRPVSIETGFGTSLLDERPAKKISASNSLGLCALARYVSVHRQLGASVAQTTLYGAKPSPKSPGKSTRLL